jgi:hypothetical protein
MYKCEMDTLERVYGPESRTPPDGGEEDKKTAKMKREWREEEY